MLNSATNTFPVQLPGKADQRFRQIERVKDAADECGVLTPPGKEPAEPVQQPVPIPFVTIDGQGSVRLGHRQPRFGRGGETAVGASLCQGIGVRLPSRPRNSGQYAMPNGSRRCSGRKLGLGETEFLALVQADGAAQQSSNAMSRRAKAGSGCAWPRRGFHRETARSTSWLLKRPAGPAGLPGSREVMQHGAARWASRSRRAAGAACRPCGVAGRPRYR